MSLGVRHLSLPPIPTDIFHQKTIIDGYPNHHLSYLYPNYYRSSEWITKCQRVFEFTGNDILLEQLVRRGSRCIVASGTLRPHLRHSFAWKFGDVMRRIRSIVDGDKVGVGRGGGWVMMDGKSKKGTADTNKIRFSPKPPIPWLLRQPEWAT